MAKKTYTFDADVTQRDDVAYWAAALALAIRAGDGGRVKVARWHLRRLGIPLDIARPRRNDGKGADDER